MVGVVGLIAFILGRCNGYGNADEERLKLREQARVSDSTRAEETKRAKQYDLEDSVKAVHVVDSFRKAEQIEGAASKKYFEEEEIITKKIKDAIKNPDNTDLQRVQIVRDLFAKQRLAKARIDSSK